MNLAPGAALGAYRISAPIGRGGMATVYKAYQPGLSRYVAIKVLPPTLAGEAGFEERFRQEAVAIARLRHPNILSIFEYGEERGMHYLITEYVDGGELSDQLGVPLPVSYVVGMLDPIAAALDYAHARGIFHRDVKPSNILLHRGGKPVLADFGVAKLVDSSQRLTQTGAVLGTPEYMAPEQALGQPFTAASDQYALAIVAYQMLTGRVPYTADTPVAVLLAHLQQPLPPPRAINPTLGRDVETALLRGLAKRPEDRYPNVSAFTSALAGAGRVQLNVRPPTGERAAPAGAALGVARDAAPKPPNSALARLSWGQALAWFAFGAPLYLPFLVLLLLVLAALARIAPAAPFTLVGAALVIAVALLANLCFSGVLAGVLAVAAERRARGLPADLRSVYAALGRRLWALVSCSLLGGGVLLAPTLSMVGLPLAALCLLDWSVAGPVVAVEQRAGFAALRRSADILRGSRGRALAAIAPITLAGVLLAVLLRAILGGLLSVAFSTLATLLAIAVAGLVAVPVLAAAAALLFAECRGDVERDDPAALATSPATPRPGSDASAWQRPRR